MFYCVCSTYKAGGNVFREKYAVTSANKPLDSESEYPWEAVVKKYFDTEEEADRYYASLVQNVAIT